MWFVVDMKFTSQFIACCSRSFKNRDIENIVNDPFFTYFQLLICHVREHEHFCELNHRSISAADESSLARCMAKSKSERIQERLAGQPKDPPFVLR